MGSEQKGDAHIAQAPAQGQPGCDFRSTSSAAADADSQVENVEAEALERRRESWGLPGGDTIGLALSGGGIRSATFSLGVLRELSALGLLTRFDYLSTVSGGTYIGSFFGGLFVPRTKSDGTKEEAVVKATPPATGELSDPLGCDEARKAIGLHPLWASSPGSTISRQCPAALTSAHSLAAYSCRAPNRMAPKRKPSLRRSRQRQASYPIRLTATRLARRSACSANRVVISRRPG